VAGFFLAARFFVSSFVFLAAYQFPAVVLSVPLGISQFPCHGAARSSVFPLRAGAPRQQVSVPRGEFNFLLLVLCRVPA
jgi:hypothetical protein